MTVQTYWKPGEEGVDLPATAAQITDALEMQEERREFFTEEVCAEYTRAELGGLTRAEVSRVMDDLADGVC
ncbi:hypothetical protein [Streptomyces aureocirculatus]|uniref:hypothetical protein n=1 Tax=Streptomyces aureocirculatus TaxID=67275 RepID=UPI0004CBFCE0|nr:hypothetical protein [Streptomyces aureocirculatus]